MSFSFTEKKRIRKDFGKQKPALDVPDLLTLQVKSYEAFLQRDIDPAKGKKIAIAKTGRSACGLTQQRALVKHCCGC